MFCSKCGNKIDMLSKFCSKCGQPIHQAANGGAAPGNSGSFTLTINRAKQWFAVNPAVKIVIDGSVEYKIGNGETLNIPILAGADRKSVV